MVVVVGGSVARGPGAIVVVVIETGCGVAVVVVVDAVVVVVEAVVVVVVEADARIHARMPRLRPRAPSTPSELVIPGLVMN